MSLVYFVNVVDAKSISKFSSSDTKEVEIKMCLLLFQELRIINHRRFVSLMSETSLLSKLNKLSSEDNL